MLWSADFETINNENDCRVWCWKALSMDETSESTGLTIESFIEFVEKRKNGDVIYFHNLKFDGEFIVYHLLKTSWKLIRDKTKLSRKTFKTVISDMGQWYSIQLMTSKGQRVTIKDSLKIWNNSIKELAKTMHMDIGKGEIDYNLYRAPGYEPTSQEWEYIDLDVRIAARAMKFMLDQGYTKLTAGANALWDYQMMIGKQWEYYFPVLPDSTDEFIRHSYRGGWCYANPLFQEKVVGKGIVLDVNSLYPSRMYYDELPYGNPIYYEGKYRPDAYYPLYVQHIMVDFELRKGYFPTVQKKHDMRFANTEYIRGTNGDPIELYLTSIDLELLKEHYDIKAIEYLDGYKFKLCKGMFGEYIDKWMAVKEEATLSGDAPRRAQSKLFMNSLYGKFAKRPYGQSKYPYIGEDDRLHLELGDVEDRGSLYIPIGTFITSYARNYTIRSAQKNYSRFLYADTDSLHLLGEKIPSEIHVHKTELGAWKHESTFHRAKFIGAKCYCEEEIVSRETLESYLEDNPNCQKHVNFENSTLLKITCAGLSEKAKHSVGFDDFGIGLVVYDKLMPKHVPGGIVLKETTFEIKRR